MMQKNYHSLMDHLGSGKEWDLHGKNPTVCSSCRHSWTSEKQRLRMKARWMHCYAKYKITSAAAGRSMYCLCNSLIVFNADFREHGEKRTKNPARTSA